MLYCMKEHIVYKLIHVLFSKGTHTVTHTIYKIPTYTLRYLFAQCRMHIAPIIDLLKVPFKSNTHACIQCMVYIVHCNVLYSVGSMMKVNMYNISTSIICLLQTFITGCDNRKSRLSLSLSLSLGFWTNRIPHFCLITLYNRYNMYDIHYILGI